VPRATLQASRCRRFASTEAVAVEEAKPPIVSTQRPKKISEPLNVKMHRMLYPEYYERVDKKSWIPRPGVKLTRVRRPAKKPIAVKWTPTMRNKGVNTDLSMSTYCEIHRTVVVAYLYVQEVKTNKPSRPTIRHPHLLPPRAQHQENLSQSHRRRNRRPNRPPRPLQRTNPPLRKRQPRMRARRRHPACAPTHR
jgi:hypothetical protein